MGTITRTTETTTKRRSSASRAAVSTTTVNATIETTDNDEDGNATGNDSFTFVETPLVWATVFVAGVVLIALTFVCCRLVWCTLIRGDRAASCDPGTGIVSAEAEPWA